jgi:hypothetical protein
MMHLRIIVFKSVRKDGCRCRLHAFKKFLICQLLQWREQVQR